MGIAGKDSYGQNEKTAEGRSLVREEDYYMKRMAQTKKRL